MTQHRFVVLVPLVALVSVLTAKPTVRLFHPPPGQYGLERLWRVEVRNPDAQTYKVRLRGEVSEAAKGVVFTAETEEFEIQAHQTKVLRYGSPELQMASGYPTYAKGYEQFAARTGGLPPGDYTFKVWLLPDFGEGMVRFRSEPAGPPRLVSPKNGAELQQEPLFTWMPPRPKPSGTVSYRLKLVEVLPGQSVEEALEANPAWFERKGIRSTSFRYPVSGRRIEKGRKYAWQVTAEASGIRPLVSERWSFTRPRTWEIGKAIGPIQVLVPLKIQRDATRVGNWYRVKLTLTNIGGSALTEIRLRDSHHLFQCADDARRRRVPPPGGEQIPGWTTEWEDAVCHAQGVEGEYGNELVVGLGNWPLPPGQSFEVSYTVLPLLTAGGSGAGHTIGARLQAFYRIGSDQYATDYEGKSVYPVPGLAQAWNASDYIICTRPSELQQPGINDVLCAMARLAKAREGALLYFAGSFLTASTVRSTLKARGTALRNGWQDGYLLIVGEEDVIPHRPDFTDWYIKNGMMTQSKTLTRSDYYYSDLGGDRRPEIAVGRVLGRDGIELKFPIEVSLSVKAHEAENDGSRVMMISGHEKIGDVFPVTAESGAAYLHRVKGAGVACWHGEYYSTAGRTMHKAIIHAPWPMTPFPRGASKCCKYCNPRPCGCCNCLNNFNDKQLAAWVLQEDMGKTVFDAKYPPASGDATFLDVNGRPRRVPAVFGSSQILAGANASAQIEFARGGYFGKSYLFLPTNEAAHDLFVSRVKSNMAGRDFIVYSGHAGGSGWYGVDAGTVAGADLMSSQTRPIAACFGCSGGDYPCSGNSISRVFLRQGAGAYIGATQMINTDDSNRQVRDRRFLKHWAKRKRIGDVVRDWKEDMAAHTVSTNGCDLRLLYVMNLYGDPKFGGD
jgi:hypothetical protein